MLEEKIKDIFITSCYEALKLQNKKGEMPFGHNGSYHDIETPIRNTAHWIVSFSKAFEITKDKLFYDAVVLGLSCLKDDKWRPNKKTFYCREKKGKDKCNGLIGQAWVIEGLIRGFEVTGDIESLELATEVFKKHPFDKERGIWHRIEPDGEVLGIDFTFNHQLWFAMSGFLIVKFSKDNVIESQCNSFMKMIPKNLKLSSKGRIGQSMKLDFINDVIKILVKKIVRKKEIRYMKLKEIGYHAFNTYAFSKIKSTHSDLTFFKTNIYRRITRYLISDEYTKGILVSDYGFPYNPPGFEVAYTYLVNKNLLIDEEKKLSKLLEIQIENHYNENNCSFSENVHDINTSSARIYELSECL